MTPPKAATTPAPKKKLPPAGRKLTLAQSLDRNNKRYDKLLNKLAK